MSTVRRSLTSMMLDPFPFKVEEFADWYRELGNLKIFWAKPLKELKILMGEDSHLIKVEWNVRRGVKRGIICIAKALDEALKEIKRFKGKGVSLIMLVPEDQAVEDVVKRIASARSILYFWDVNAKTLTPNMEVNVVALRDWNEGDEFKSVQRRSWGFYIPPVKGKHIVLLATFKGKVVGLTYLNLKTFNLDFGIHVVKEFWRRRIGTRLLSESLKLAREHGGRLVSVVRVLRSVRWTSSDRRALGFYRANMPKLRFSVMRLKL